MPGSGWGWVVIATCGLLGLAKVRRPLENIDLSGYRATFAGALLLTLAALLELYRTLLPDGFTANDTNDLLFRLGETIGVLTGAAFMASGGMHLLLASLRHQTERIAAVEHLLLLKEIEQLVQVESRPRILLEKALAHMCRYAGASEGRAYVKSAGNGIGISIAEVRHTEQASLPEEMQFGFDYSEDDEPQFRLDIANANALTIPVMVAGRPIAVFSILAESTAMPEGTASLLNMTAKVLARRFERDANRLMIQHHQAVEEFRNAQDSRVPVHSSLRTQLATVRQELVQLTCAEICALVTINPNRQLLTRRSVSAPLAYLEERDLPVSERFVTLAQGIRESILLPSGEDESPDNFLSVLVPGDARSAIVAPLKSEAESRVFLIAAAYGETKLQRRDLDFVAAAARHIEQSLAVESLLTQAQPSVAPIALDVIPTAELRSHVKSSLSSILGSVELIRHSEEIDPQSMQRYIGIIDRSAQRLRTYVEPEAQEEDAEHRELVTP